MTERFSAPGATLVKLFGRPADETREFVARAARVRDIGVRTAMVQWVFVTALTLVSALALALVYGLGGYFALTGGMAPGDVVALALLLTRLYAPLTALASARVEVMSALVSFERVFEVLDLPPLIAEPAHPGRCPTGRCRWSSTPSASATRPPTRCRWRRWRRSPSSTRRGGEEVLHDVSFRAEPGADGRAGRLVGGGQVHDRAAAPPALRRRRRRGAARRGRRPRPVVRLDPRGRSAWSPRTGTCSTSRSAPTCCSPGPRPSEAELWDVLRRARLAELVASLPDGLDTVVGERGYRLSGGERQRLTIARLLLAQPRVVVLDEATAHLDSTSEAAVQEALGEALAGRTAVVIAHRLSTIRAADLILVLEDGRDRRARHPRGAAGGGRPVRRAVPHPVRRPGQHRRGRNGRPVGPPRPGRTRGRPGRPPASQPEQVLRGRSDRQAVRCPHPSWTMRVDVPAGASPPRPAWHTARGGRAPRGDAAAVARERAGWPAGRIDREAAPLLPEALHTNTHRATREVNTRAVTPRSNSPGANLTTHRAELGRVCVCRACRCVQSLVGRVRQGRVEGRL